MYPKTLLLLTILALNLCVFSQTETKTASKTDEVKKLEANAVELLKETSSDVNNLRSLPNRIGFSAELASLMWFHDERQAKQMYGSVVSDFRELLARYNADFNALSSEAIPGTAEDPSDRMLAEKRMRTAISVAQQIATSIADHDPELAINFYFDSVAAISNVEFRKQVELQNNYFESQLLTKIAQKNPSKVVPYAIRSLGRGFSGQHLQMLRDLYAKDPDAAVAFGDAIVSSLRSSKIDANNWWAVSELLGIGTDAIRESKKPGGKRAVFSESQLREVSESLAAALLDLKRDDLGMVEGLLVQIERYTPGRAAQVRSKFGIKKTPLSVPQTEVATVGVADPEITETAMLEAKVENNPQMQAALEQSKKNDQMMQDAEKLSNKELSTEERSKLIAQVRKIIAQTPGREKKIGALCFLAAQVKIAGDKELAASILKEAASFVNPQPKNYQDFLLTWSLAAGYASAEPDSAFALLEDTISRANDTIEAFVKVGEFIDITGEMVDEGEVQVGALGGSMVRSMTPEMGLADATITLLARADFAKTRDLTNKFERAEVRVLAKMLVIRSILTDKTPQKPESEKAMSTDQ